MLARYRMFAGYNAWANRRLYDAAAQLSDAEYRADKGAFFRSMHGTLNHLLTTDRIWMKRFTGEGEAPLVELAARLASALTALESRPTDCRTAFLGRRQTDAAIRWDRRRGPSTARKSRPTSELSRHTPFGIAQWPGR